MTDAAAFSATLVDFKIIRTRKCVQFVFEEDAVEVPADIVSEILADLAALVDGKIKFALARLNHKETETGAAQNPVLDDCNGSAPAADRRPSSARNPLAQRAAICCDDPQFRLFLEKSPSTKQMLPRGCHINNEKEAAMIVRSFCRVESRSHILWGTDAGDRWENLYSQFIVWKNAERYVEAPRVQQENQA